MYLKKRKLLNRIALVLAVLCIGVNVVNMFVPFKTYGIDSFLLAGVMFAMAFNFKGDERMNTFWIFCLIVAVMGVAAGVMNIIGV